MTQQTFISKVTDDSWMRGLHTGHLVELLVYGQTMIGKVTRIAPDNITVRIPLAAQSDDVRRYFVTGTAVVSIDGAAARVPVSAQATGEYISLQVIGPVEIIQRRLHARIPLEVPARLCWQNEADSPWIWAVSRTQDISVGGVRVASTRAVWPSVDGDVRIEIDLPNGTVQERAKVIGKTPDYDLRLAFVGLRRAATAQIRELTSGGR